MAIQLHFNKTDADLTGQSKWWGAPDMPDGMDIPCVPVEDEGDEYDDPLTFLCQIRCADIAALDPEGLLPHEGMLYFFAALDYYLGNFEAILYPGMGEWESPYFKVLYSPTCDDLRPIGIVYDDGTPAFKPAEALTFEAAETFADDFKLLGKPFYEEIREEYDDQMVSLLQVNEDDDWQLHFYDCGMLHFLITPDDLKHRRWNQCKCYVNSF